MFSSFLHTPIAHLTCAEIGAIQAHAKSAGNRSVFLTVYVDSMDDRDYIEDLWGVTTGDRKAFVAAPDGVLFGVDVAPGKVLGMLWGAAGHFSDGINVKKFAAAQPFVDQVLRGA